jgi:hypothetical protein
MFVHTLHDWTNSEFWTEFSTSYSLTALKDMLFSGEVIRLTLVQCWTFVLLNVDWTNQNTYENNKII